MFKNVLSHNVKESDCAIALIDYCYYSLVCIGRDSQKTKAINCTRNHLIWWIIKVNDIYNLPQSSYIIVVAFKVTNKY